MEKKFSLSKEEIDRLNIFLTIAKMQEEILLAITERYRNYLLKNVFKRLGLKEEEFPFSTVDLRSGQLIIRKPENEKIAK